MLSRVADSIYWMNRFIERAEDTARVIDVNLTLSLDLPPGAAEQWEPLLLTTGDLPFFKEHFQAPTRADVIEFMTFDSRNPNSILRCLESARENARSVRDQISSEMWEQLNRLYLLVRSARFRGLVESEPHEFYARIKLESHLFEGITDGTMSRNEAWHFGRLGRKLERADKTSRILDVKYFILLPAVTEVGTPFDDLQWSALLRSVGALEMYRKRHGRIAPDRVAEFLILDRDFPRSILYCLTRAEQSLHAITGSAPGTFSNHPEQLVGRLRSHLSYTPVHDVIGVGLHEFLDALQAEMNRIDDAVHQTYFALRPTGDPEPELTSSSLRPEA
jgi:uncharacterized alpha-E superfamily protein